MTKEELEKEAYKEAEKLKEYQTKPNNEYEKGYNNGEVRGYKDGYRDGAEPREKRIEELEKENAELSEQLLLVSEQLRLAKEMPYSAVKKFAEEKTQGQLTKAKELLKKWVELYKPKLEGYPITPIQEQTEQFLSEVEK